MFNSNPKWDIKEINPTLIQLTNKSMLDNGASLLFFNLK